MDESFVRPEDLTHNGHWEKELQSRAVVREYEALKKREYRERRKHKSFASFMDADAASMHTIVREIVQYFIERTRGMEKAVKCRILNQVLEHPAMLGLLDQAFREEQQVQSTLLANVRNTLAIVKQPSNKDELFLKKSALAMLMNSSKDLPVAKVARVMQVTKHSLYRARSSVEAKSAHGSGLFSLAACRKQQRSSTISEELKELVYTFWQSESRVSPNKKDVCRKRLGRKSYIKHPIHLLDVPQVYHLFCAK
ncbi:hypothetical protein L7F22_037839 [Adiantum nelumboides]|nr:hypothetical protein [Adiantum nelumboides]